MVATGVAGGILFTSEDAELEVRLLLRLCHTLNC
jgi:hypothetical protein